VFAQRVRTSGTTSHAYWISEILLLIRSHRDTGPGANIPEGLCCASHNEQGVLDGHRSSAQNKFQPFTKLCGKNILSGHDVSASTLCFAKNSRVWICGSNIAPTHWQLGVLGVYKHKLPNRAWIFCQIKYIMVFSQTMVHHRSILCAYLAFLLARLSLPQ